MNHERSPSMSIPKGYTKIVYRTDMEVTIFTNFDVTTTHWYKMIDESYDITQVSSIEPKWTIDLPRKEIKKFNPLITASGLAVTNMDSEDSVTIYAVLNKIPSIDFYTENQLFSNKVGSEMKDLAMKIETKTSSNGRINRNSGIQYGGGVDTNVVNSILSRLKIKFDIEITSQLKWEDSDDIDCRVFIPLPENFNPFTEIGYDFTVFTDSEDVLQDISDNGIKGLEIEKVVQTNYSIWRKYQPFEIKGPTRLSEDEAMQSLLEIINNYLSENLNVDKQEQILKITENSDSEKIELYLPIQQHRDQLLPSNVGEGNNRYMIHIQSDSEEELERLSSHFQELGYLVKADLIDDDSVIQHHSETGNALGDSIQQFDNYLTKYSILHDPVLIENKKLHSNAMKLVLPTKKRPVQKKVSGISTFKLRYTENNTKDKLLKKIKNIGYEKIRIDDDWESGVYQITFGGMKIDQIVLLNTIFKKIFDIPDAEKSTFVKQWDDSDKDVTLYIPEKYKISASSIDDDSITQWLEMENRDSTRPYIRIEAGESVRIGETLLNLYENKLNDRSPPDADQFSLYCIDQATANTLNIVGSNVATNEPCLLEGETATSKTSIILFLAHLIQQPVTRINLNGQTDTGELIGRYVPNDSEDSNVQWVWENGEIIKAMKYGWWVILDEVNLAEPQILERLNSLLEKTPTLKATETSPAIEYGGSSGELVHPSFRIFATMNPAEYSGRIALSPAYKDRWTGYAYVPLASEMDILHMLNMWVFGETPPVNVDGVQYDGKQVNIPLSNLHELSKSLDVKDLIARVARSHYTLSKLASTDNSKGISMSRKERPVFSRRLLTRFMTYLDENIRPESNVGELSRVVRLGLVRYYIRRVHSEEDLSIISETLDGQGIGPNVWNLWTE
jgi:hypothetical protein